MSDEVFDVAISGAGACDGDGDSYRKRKRLNTHQSSSSQDEDGNKNFIEDDGGAGKVTEKAQPPRRGPRVIWRPGKRQSLQLRHPFMEKTYLCNLCCKNNPKTAMELQWHAHSWDISWAHMRPQQRWKPPRRRKVSTPLTAKKVGVPTEFSESPEFMSINQSGQCNCLKEFPRNQATAGGNRSSSDQSAEEQGSSIDLQVV